jgi:hypothetical protein
MKRSLAVLVLALAGCMAHVPPPTQEMAGGDESRLADLRAGRELYLAKCGGCHRLYDVESHSGREWKEQVEEMLSRKKVRLTGAEAAQLVLYLTTASARE